MSQRRVAVLEVNPVNANDVDMTMVPLSELDGFLEDIVEDFDLGFAELGAIKGKASIKVKGSVKLKTPTIKPKAVLKATAAVNKVRAALKAGIKVPKAQLKIAAKLKPIASAVTKTAKALAKKPILVGYKGGHFKFKPNVKLPTVRAKIMAKAGAKVAGKLTKKIQLKAKASSKAKIVKHLKTKPTVKLKVAAGKFPRVPVNRKAVAGKVLAKHVAGQVAALGPGNKSRVLAAASKGTPKRQKRAAKPVAICIKAFRAANVQPCIVAQKKPAGAALASNHPPSLRAKFAARKRGALPKLRFRAVVSGLLDAVESRCGGQVPPDVAARIKRIRKVSGVGNAN